MTYKQIKQPEKLINREAHCQECSWLSTGDKAYKQGKAHVHTTGHTVRTYKLMYQDVIGEKDNAPT